FHVARQLHGVVQSFFAVLQAVLDAIFNRLSDLQTKSRTKRAANSVPAKRKREASLLVPPDAKVNHTVHAKLRKQKLPFMDQEAGFYKFVLHGIKDLVKRHHHRLEVRFKQLQGEIRGRF